MIEAAAALESVKKVDEALGVIGKLMAKLKAQPDQAASKLADALKEVNKTWLVVDDAITNYLKLGLDKDAFDTGSGVLLKIQGGRLLVDVENGRGHCHIIGNIYDNYLHRWFDRVLNAAELASMNKVFTDLRQADDNVFNAMEVFARQLQTEATEVLNIFAAGDVSGAKARVLASIKELTPLQLGLSESLQKLYRLRGEFIKISGTVSS